MNLTKILKVAAVALPVMFAGACGSSKKAVSDGGSYVPTTKASALPAENFAAMVDSYTPGWQRVKVDVNVALTAPSNLSVSGRLTMERGKSIGLSMRMLGMEVAALYVTTDSITLVDRWHRRYLKEDYKRFLAGLPMDIDNVQDIFMGRLFKAGQSEVAASSASDFDFEGDAGMWVCAPKDMPTDVEYAFVCAGQLLSQFQAKAGRGSAYIDYMAPVVTPYGPMTTQLQTNALVGGKKVALTITFKPSGAVWNDDVVITQPSVGRSYSRVDGSSVLKSLGKK